MGSEELIQYIHHYGYFIIFLFLFFGIVGIPAPGRVPAVLSGALGGQKGQLMLSLTLVCSFLGVCSGVFTGFYGGRFIGLPLINRYGKVDWVIQGESVQKYERLFTKHSTDGHCCSVRLCPDCVRLSPYLAGIFGISVWDFLLPSDDGGVGHLVGFVHLCLGIGLGTSLSINPARYVPYAGSQPY